MRISHSKISAILFFFILIASTYSCKEDYYDPYYKAPSPFTGVPDNFDWSTITSINLTINVNDEYNGQYYYVVEVFDDNPILNANATLLAKGVAKQTEAFTSEVNFPQALQTIYIRQTAPNGLKTVQERTIDSKNITINFAGNTSASTKSSSVSYASTRSATTPTYQGVREGATVVNLSSSSQVLAAGKSYVITGGTYSGSITFWGGTTTTLFIEGEWNVPPEQTAFQSGLEIVILKGGKVHFYNSSQILQGNDVHLFIMNGGIFNPEKGPVSLNFGTSGGSVYNFGELNLKQLKLNGGIFYNNSTTSISEFSQAGTIENHSVLTLGTISSTNGLTINNYLTMSVTGNATCNGSTIINRGTLSFDSFDSSYSLFLDNYCNITTNKDINISGGTINLHNSTSFSGTNFYPKGCVINMDAFSILDVTGTTKFDSWSSQLKGTGTGSDYALARLKKVICNGSQSVIYSGNLELECSDHTANGKNNKVYTLNSPAHMVSYGSPTVLIPSGECTGKGSYPQGTTPTDPTFPIEVPTSSVYSYAIEDYWPAYGDYDMNDLVIKSSFTSTNNKNWITSLTINVTLLAVGGTKKLGAAFQLDKISADNVTSVSVESDSPGNRLNGTVFTLNSNGIEAGQSKAVIPLFDEAHHFILNNSSERYYMINTSDKGEYITPKNVKITIKFKKNRVNSSDIAVKYLNYFVVTDAKSENRKEVHLPGYSPTNKAITSYFGGGPQNIPSNNDLSLNGIYYRGTDNLIWGLIIPGTFNYPLETESILNAYPKFKSWATSGGTANQNWYSSSNANSTYIYTIK